MTERALTMEGIRSDFIQLNEQDHSRGKLADEFDRWLNEIRAEAWTEGFDRGFYRGQILHGDYDACEAGIKNPYLPNEK